MTQDIKTTLAREAKTSAKVGAVGFTTALVTQGSVSVALPTLMSYTGTVVSGVGTTQAAFISPLASFAVAPVTAVALPAAGAAVTVYLTYKGGRWAMENKESIRGALQLIPNTISMGKL